MNFIPIYNTNTNYYCYSLNEKKIYIGSQKEFKPNLLFFLGIYLVPLISERVDKLFIYAHESFYVVLHMLFFLGGIVVGNLIYRKYSKKIYCDIKELVLTQKEIKAYIEKGKSQFLLQIVILVGILLGSVLFVILEYFSKSILYSFLKFIFVLCFTLTVLWIKPYKRIKLLKALE